MKTNLFLVFFLFFCFNSNAQQGGFTKISVPDMNTARMECKGALFSDSTYVIFGGHIPGFIPTNTAELLAPRATSWIQMTMKDIRDASASARIDSNRVMIAGGMSTSSGVGQLSSAEIYDARNRSFTSTAPMNVARTMFSGTRLTTGELLFVGNWYNTAAQAEIYNPANNTFTLTGNVAQERSCPYVVPRSDNGAMVFGGYGVYGGYVEKVEFFNYSNKSFTLIKNNIFENETGWYCAKGYPNSAFYEQDMTIDGKFYFSVFKNMGNNVTAYRVVSFDPDSMIFRNVFTHEDLLTYNPGDSLVPYLAGKIMVDRRMKRLYFWVNQPLLSSSGNFYMSLYGYDLIKNKLFFTPGYQIFNYNNMMGNSVVLSDGNILIAGGNFTSNFDAHKHCFIAAPDGQITGIVNHEMVDGNQRLSAFANENYLQIYLYDFPFTTCDVKLMDLQGKCVFTGSHELQKGTQAFRLNMGKALTKGIYLLQITAGKECLNFKLLVR
jgi:hypothetical protein